MASTKIAKSPTANSPWHSRERTQGARCRSDRECKRRSGADRLSGSRRDQSMESQGTEEGEQRDGGADAKDGHGHAGGNIGRTRRPEPGRIAQQTGEGSSHGGADILQGRNGAGGDIALGLGGESDDIFGKEGVAEAETAAQENQGEGADVKWQVMPKHERDKTNGEQAGTEHQHRTRRGFIGPADVDGGH